MATIIKQLREVMECIEPVPPAQNHESYVMAYLTLDDPKDRELFDQLRILLSAAGFHVLPGSHTNAKLWYPPDADYRRKPGTEWVMLTTLSGQVAKIDLDLLRKWVDKHTTG